MLVDLRNKGLTGKVAEKALDRAGITVNKNTVPRETRVAVRHERHSHRHAGRDHPWHGGTGNARDRRADRTRRDGAR